MTLPKPEFERRFAHSELHNGYPLDLVDMRRKFSSTVETFFEQKGLIIFMCQLKLLTAREQFENLYKKHRQTSDDDVDIVVTTCRELCTLLCKKPLNIKLIRRQKKSAAR